MRTLSLYLVAAVLASCSTSNKTTMQSNTSHEAAGQDWITLFDGTSTAGWHTYGKTGVASYWRAENGVLHLDPEAKKAAPKGEGGDLVTNDEFENYHLKLEWKISPKGNSGVIFNVKEDAAAYPATYNTGPEMQVLDNGTPTALGHSDAKLYTHRAGDLYDLVASKEAAKPAGEWNAAEIVLNKGKLDFYLNGQHTLSTTMWDDNWNKMVAISKFKDMAGFAKFRSGRIALQDHGDEVWFRNIKIRKL
jgi:hypothetical protein